MCIDMLWPNVTSGCKGENTAATMVQHCGRWNLSFGELQQSLTDLEEEHEQSMYPLAKQLHWGDSPLLQPVSDVRCTFNKQPLNNVVAVRMSISVILSRTFILLGVDCAAHPPSSKTLLYVAQTLRAMRLLLTASFLFPMAWQPPVILVFAFQSPVMNPTKSAVSVPASAATTTSHCFSWWTCKAPILG